MGIKIKSVNDCLLFVFDENEIFFNLMKELESLLDRPMFSNDGFFPKAFFDFKSRILEEHEIGLLLEILFHKQVVMLIGISGLKDLEASDITIIDRTIHAGEEIYLDKEALIIGHINAGAIVTFTDKLYVLGTVRGLVDGVNVNSKVSGQSFKNAHIRINGVSRHRFTSLELTMLYYKDNAIYLDKGEMVYV